MLVALGVFFGLIVLKALEVREKTVRFTNKRFLVLVNIEFDLISIRKTIIVNYEKI